MAANDWIDLLETTLEGAGLLAYYPPVLAPQDVTVLPFGPYKAESGAWQFRTAMRIETVKASARDLRAPAAGSILFEASTSGPGKVIFLRGDAAGSAVAFANGLLPSWFPKAPLVYENVDTAEAKKAAVDILGANDEAKRSLERIKKKNPTAKELTKTELADLWLKGNIPQGLSVKAGARIGACAENPAISGSYYVTLSMSTTGVTPKMFYNPSYLFALWEEKGWLKSSLPSKFSGTSGPPAGTGKLVFVSGGGSGKISSALKEAKAGDIVLILDNKSYEDAIVLDKPIAITSVAEPGDYVNYPILSGDDSERPVTIKNTAGVEFGMAHVGKITIEKGLGTGNRKDGGGILVERSNPVVIANVRIRKCKAPGTGYFAEGFGGGIAIYYSSPAILGSLIEENDASGRGMGIGVYGYSWPTIVGCTIQKNGLNSLGGRGDGGGLGVEIAVSNSEDALHYQFRTNKSNLKEEWTPTLLQQAKSRYMRVIGCQILSNRSLDDGGGVYVSVASGVLFRSTAIASNRTVNDGGGLRATMGSRIIIEGCQIIDNESNLLKRIVNEHGDPLEVGGGGLSARNLDSMIIRATSIGGNVVNTVLSGNVANGFAGGGIYFISTDEGTYDGIGLDFDWNDILWDVFGHAVAVLRINGGSSLKLNSATQLPGQGNHGKGGAAYFLRWAGKRRSGLPIPPDKMMPNGDLRGLPIQINISDIESLKHGVGFDNIASFANSNRMYLDDQTGSSRHILDDRDLVKIEDEGKKEFQYS